MPVNSAKRIADPVMRSSIENFLYEESGLLDDHCYEAWVNLFTEDATYRIPVRRNVSGAALSKETAGPDEIAHVDDDKSSLVGRIKRIKSGFAWTEQPASRTRRIISNVRVYETDDPSRFFVRSNFVCYMSQHDYVSETFFGEHQDILFRMAVDDYRIERRLVLLDQNVIDSNLAIFL